MPSNLSSKHLRYASMMASLFLRLKEDLGLSLSAIKDYSSFLKCHISHSFLPYSSNSVFNFTQSILVALDTNFKPFDSNETSGVERFLLERFYTFLLTKMSYNLTPICEAVLSPFKVLLSFSQLERFSVLLHFSFLLSSIFNTSERPGSSWKVWEALLIFPQFLSVLFNVLILDIESCNSLLVSPSVIIFLSYP